MPAATKIAPRPVQRRLTDQERARRRKGLLVLAIVVAVMAFGAFGFYLLGDGQWSLMTCTYMTVVTLSTVGYGEVIPITGHADRELFTMVLLLVGMGTIFYAVSTFSAFIIEGTLLDTVRRKRVEKILSRISGHYIVCGAGRSGSVTVRELVSSGYSVVAIDQSAELLERLRKQIGETFVSVVGDATEDHILEYARIDSAKGLVTALSEDRDNLYVTVSARQLNPALRIVSKSLNDPAKIERAGADAVVWLNAIGGHRLFSELVRPQAINLIEELLLDPSGLSVAEVEVEKGAPLADLPLGDKLVRATTNVIFAAVRCPVTGRCVHNPGPDQVLTSGTTIIAMGLESELEHFRKQVTREALPFQDSPLA